jgi:hypothetical protein
MKPIFRIIGLIVLLAALAAPSVAFAQGGEPQDQLIFGGDYTLQAGESVGNLTVLGGNVELEAGSDVVDHIYMFGGNLTVNGAVGEDIHMYGGNLDLGDSAVVGGDVSIAGGSLDQSAGATINGSVTRGVVAPFGIPIPDAPILRWPRFWSGVDPIVSRALWFLVQTFGLTALAMLVILFAPKVTERAGDAALARPWAAGGIGLLVAIVTPPLLVGFAISVIGIPITLLLAAAVVVVLTFGWIALGLEVGKRLSSALHQPWPAVVSAGLGTLLLSLVANGIGQTPCVGWIVPALVGFVGMGGVFLSRFGTQTYPMAAPIAPVAAA